MADNQTIDNGDLTNFTATANELADGSKAQSVQVLRSDATGPNDVVAADASGLKVQLGASVPAGTANIGDVDVASIAAGDTTIGRIKITDGTNVASVRDLANDALNVAIVDGAGNQVTSFGGSGGTSMTDDAAFTPGSGSITPAGFLFDDTSPDSVNEGDAGIGRMSANRNVYVTVRDAAGNERGLNIDASGNMGVPAADRTTDSISSVLALDRLMQDQTERTPVFAAVDVAGSGDNTLVTAQGASNKIRVHQVFLMAASAVTVRFESGAGGTALTGQMQVGANGGFVLPFSPIGWFETATNTLLNLELSSAVSVDGVLLYTVVT